MDMRFELGMPWHSCRSDSFKKYHWQLGWEWVELYLHSPICLHGMVGVQEVRWDNDDMEPADGYIFFCANGNDRHI